MILGKYYLFGLLTLEVIGNHHPGWRFFSVSLVTILVKKQLKLLAIWVESVILFPSLSLKKSGNFVCFLFSVFCFRFLFSVSLWLLPNVTYCGKIAGLPVKKSDEGNVRVRKYMCTEYI